jgi:hypothetical protein
MRSFGEVHFSTAVPAALIFIFFFSVFSLTMQGAPTGGDAWGMYLVAASIVKDGDIFLDGSDRVVLRRGVDDRWVSKYGIGQSLAELPLYAVGQAVSARAKPADPGLLQYFITSFTAPLVSAGICAVFFLLCAGMGYGSGASLAAVFFLGLGSLVWPQSKTLFSEPLQGLCLVAGFYMLYLWRKSGGALRACAAGLLIGLMAAAKPFLLLATPPLIFYFIGGLRMRTSGRNRFSATVFFFAGLAFWIAVICYYNWIRFGDVFEFGYLSGTDRDAVHGFRLPFLVGMHGLLFSSGKGLIFYVPWAPPLIFAVRPFAKRRSAEAWTIGAVFLILLAGYSKWNAWHGDFSWGPRFLAPAVPLLALPLCELLEGDGFLGRACGKAALAGVFAVSLFVNILGVAVNYNEYFLITKSQAPFQIFAAPDWVELRDDLLNDHYFPEFSPLAGHYWLLRHTLLDRGLLGKERNAEMRKDFPWKGAMQNDAPYDPCRGAGFDAWWRYLLKFYPGGAPWAPPLCMAFAGLFIISGGALAMFFRTGARKQNV